MAPPFVDCFVLAYFAVEAFELFMGSSEYQDVRILMLWSFVVQFLWDKIASIFFSILYMSHSRNPSCGEELLDE